MKETLLTLVMACVASVGVAATQELPLKGSWKVSLDGGATSTEIALPGTLSDAKLGPAATEAVYGALTPRHQFVGKAIYTKSITVSPEMSGDYELFLERVMWKSTLAWDGTDLGSCDSLAAPHVYTIPAKLMSPGAHTLTLTIDNSRIYNIGEKSHSYGDSMQTRWNGAIGELVLRPVNPLQKARVFAPAGDTVTIEVPGKTAFKASIEGAKSTVVSSEPGKVVLRIPGAKLWSTFEPNLYTVVLSAEGYAEEKIRFGFRTLEVKGNRAYVNGQPFFVRGNTDNCHFPLTGYPAMDKATWKELLAKMKDEGINQVRCHTWATPKAAFEAADELGLFISPEVLWIDGWMTRDYPDIKGVGKGPKEVDTFVHNELFRILNAYGNAPSFFSMSVGNELGSSDFNLLGDWMKECKAYDNRHLYAASSARQISKGDDFFVTHNYPGVGMVRERRREGTNWDYEDVYSRTKLPTIAHEIGQWPVYPLFDEEIPQYRGLLRPWNLEKLRAESEQAGVLRFNKAFRRASLMTCLLMYKDEIESFERTPSCAGLQLLGIQDYSGQGEALIGWFDSFYNRKSGAEDALPVANYFAPTAYLARFAKYTWQTNETLTVKLVVHNYGEKALKGSIPWSFAGKKGSVRVDVPVGAVQQVEELKLPLRSVKAPAKHTLTFGNNQWSLWVYPEKITSSVPAGVVFTEEPSEAKAALAAGKTVLLDAHGCANPQQTVFSAFNPVYWSTTWFPGQRNTTLGMVIQEKSGAFKLFPTEDWQDWQWKHLVNGAQTFKLSGTSKDFVPLAMPVVDFHRPTFAALLFEAKVGKGKILVSGIDLSSKRPEAQQLKKSLLAYVGSKSFAPKGTISETALFGLFNDLRASLPPRPAEYKDAVAYFECAALLAQKNKDNAWSKKLDRAELTAGSYALSGDGLRTWSDKDGSYWVGNSLTLTLSGATNIRGKLLVRFRDPDHGSRTAKGTFDGNRSFTIPNHGKSATNKDGSYWLTLPVDMEDFLDGKLQLNIQKTSGPNIMIDRVILIPNES